jgi:hypothetical protein
MLKPIVIGGPDGASASAATEIASKIAIASTADIAPFSPHGRARPGHPRLRGI